MRKKILFLLLGMAIVATYSSCTKLEEQVLDESPTAGKTDKQIAEGLLAPVYAKLPDIFLHTNYFALQEISTDEAILPFRGSKDWGDGGIYMSLHKHETATSDNNVKSTWNHIMQGISRAVLALDRLPENTDPNAKLFMAEARGMRAYYSLLSLDLFGLVFVKEKPDDLSKVIRGNEAIEYIQSELLAVEPQLQDAATGPGRLTKAAVWGLLARLYLNAAVYRDRYAASFNFAKADMDKAVEYCDKIINSGQYQLATEYFSLFDDANHTNKELIFAVDQRSDLNGHNRMAYFSLSGDQWPIATNTNANGTDGPAITPDFYQSWAQAYTDDPAKVDGRFYKENMSIYSHPEDSCVTAANYKINRGILRGQQYGVRKDANGAFILCMDGKFKLMPLYNNSRSLPNLPVNFTEQVNFTTAGSNYNNGYRVSKYEFSKTTINGRNAGEHDIVIIRLADVYLMRAEAKLRRNDAPATALDDVNFVRAARTARAVPPALTNMSLDILFRERGFELYWEMVRRTDMIRFGKYEGTWTEKNNTDKNKRLFPIPLDAIDAASKIPGFLTQNPGY